MAVKVTPQRGMNLMSARTYEGADGYKRDDRGFLTVLRGTKKIAEHAAGTWESVEVIELLDQKPAAEAEKKTVKVPKKKAQKAPTRKTKIREGADIRTSPAHGEIITSQAQRGDSRKLR